jgi:hypothetical protein
MIIADTPDNGIEEEPLISADAVGMPLPQAQAASERSKSKGENNEA